MQFASACRREVLSLSRLSLRSSARIPRYIYITLHPTLMQFVASRLRDSRSVIAVADLSIRRIVSIAAVHLAILSTVCGEVAPQMRQCNEEQTLLHIAFYYHLQRQSSLFSDSRLRNKFHPSLLKLTLNFLILSYACTNRGKKW